MTRQGKPWTEEIAGTPAGFLLPALAMVLLLAVSLPSVACAQDSLSTVPSAADSVVGTERHLRLLHPIQSSNGRVISGDRQSGVTLHQMKKPLRALVVDEENEGVPGVTVSFDLVTPIMTSIGRAITDPGGFAQIKMTAGKVAGMYTVTARIPGEVGDQAQIVYHMPVHKPDWVLMMVFGLVGGLGLFLFGMEMMSRALQRSAGGRMRAILGALTRHRLIGVAVGAFVTMVIQSSSATTVMLVSFVEARLMSFAQTLGVILGAHIGTTVTAQLIAFKLTDYALLMIGIGFGLTFLTKKGRIRGIGEAVLGFGILFYGMSVMSQAMSPLRTYQPFLDILLGLENPIFGILIGMVFTALIQSSSAFTGIIIVLAQQGFLTLTAGIPLIFGANIGTCITAFLASIGSSREARRVAVAHIFVQVAGVLLFLMWIPQFADLIRKISPGGGVLSVDQEIMARLIPRQIANAHTLFNTATALLFLPLTGVIASVLTRLLPDRIEVVEYEYKAKHLDRGMLAAPALALNLAKVEILRMGNKARVMGQICLEPFLHNNVQILDKFDDLEEEVDALEEQITSYLLAIGEQDISKEQASEVYLMMHVCKQFEQFADTIHRDLRTLAQKKISSGVVFSDSGRAEVEAYHLKMVKQVSRSLIAFRDVSLEKAKHMKKKQAKYVNLAGAYRQAHFERVREAIQESVESSAIHLELMDILRRLNSYTANIARAILAQSDHKREKGQNAPTPDLDLQED